MPLIIDRLLKRLRKKNKSQIELEQKEQGFSLYVNGPHKDGRAQTNAGGKQTIPTQPKTGRKPKTAGGKPKFHKGSVLTILDDSHRR